MKRRFVAFFSLLLFTVLVFAYLWWGKFQYHHDLLLIGTYVAGIALVLGNHVYQRDGRRQMGYRWDNSAKAARTFGVLTLLLAVVILLVGFWKSEARIDRWADLYVYVGWAALQQHLLQNFLRLRSEDLLGKGSRAAALLAAGLFGLYHLPNLPLVAASFAGALLWCLLFMRVPNFAGAWLSQAVLSGCLLLFFKHGLLSQFQVGKPGHRYEYYGSGVNVAGGYDAQRKPFVVALPGPDTGVAARVRVFDLDGRMRWEKTALPGLDFSGHVAVGELGWESGDEIVVAAGPGVRNPPRIQIFSSSGKLLKQIDQVLPDSGYGAWVSVACGRIYAAPGPGPDSGGFLVEVTAEGQVGTVREFDYGFVNGIRATAAYSPSAHQSDGCSRILVWGSPVSINPSRVFLCDTHSQSLESFETLPTTFGLNLTTMDLSPGQPGIAVTPGPLKGYPPLVQIFDMQGRKVREFFAFHDPQAYGSNIAAVDADGDGADEIVLGEGIGPGRPYTVRVLRQDGQLLAKWEAF